MKIYWCLFVCVASIVECQLTEEEIRATLDEYNTEAVDLCNANSLANWNVQTNVGDVDYQLEQREASQIYAAFRQNYYMSYWADINSDEIQDEQLRRQVKSLQKLGTAVLEENDLALYTATINSMSTTYNTAVICPPENLFCDLGGTDVLTLEPGITEVMANSENYDDLLQVWTDWHFQSGRLMRDDYQQYVNLMQIVAEQNSYDDAAEWWQSSYEDLDFNTIDAMWNQVKPLYNELHAYVRRRLAGIYGERMEQYSPYIPAHVTGNMWAQSWTNIYDRVKPFDADNLGKVTENMISKSYSVMQMFEEADEFFKGMGLPENSMSYDITKAVIEDPPDRTIACHASASDLCKDNDFRIKMCTHVGMEDFKVVHHEMGHIQYFIQYANQPLQLRNGANPAFHEAVGDALVLSFANPRHLAKIQLLGEEEVEETREGDINGLFLMALERIAFMPFGLLIDKWRWEVFNGTIGPDQWNTRWWELRKEYQQIVPPTERGEEFFDPGAKYHIPANSQYIGYFFARLLQFQFYKSMCIAAGEYNPNDVNSQPLHKCVFDGNVDAGKKLSDGLQLGSSRHWRDILEVMTGETEMNGNALMEYFQPLHEFLREENRRLEEEDMRDFLEQYNLDASEVCNRKQNAEWNAITDLENEEKEAAYNEAIRESAAFAKAQYYEHFDGLDHEVFTDVSLQRQLRYLSKLGTDILDDERLSQLRSTNARMELIYNSAKVCPFDSQNCNLITEGLALNPGIETVMAESNNFDELLYIWREWHDNSGRLMQADYQQFMEISNEAAIANGFDDTGDMWRFEYEYDDLQTSMMDLWEVVKPLYDELHTYVLHELYTLYGPERIDLNDPLIPAHLLGNMWAQSWVNLYERIKPFPEASDIDVTSQMLEQEYTPLRMFRTADKFYTDLGLASNEMSYTGESIIEQPTDRLIVCHASAWDFCNGEDFRIKQCTLVNMNHFVTVHHEMGHIQYDIQYKDQPIPFRSGANPGFHEAVGDVIALSVATPQHLQKIGLLQNYADSVEDNINALFKMALQRVAFLPFGFLIDMYRWDLFSGKVPQEEWNSHWESLRETYQKIRSPVQRSSEDFDAGAKFHVASGYQYINYFIAHILEFQLHKSLCTKAGKYDPANPDLFPLHKCDIDGSQEAGDALKAGLSLGLSRHWSETLEIMTGETELKADALLEYFAPLRQFLRDENRRFEEDAMRDVLVQYNVEASGFCNRRQNAEWNAITDLMSQEKEAAYTEAIRESAAFAKAQYAEHFEGLDHEAFTDVSLQRQLRYLSVLGTDILDDERLTQLRSTNARMELTYNSAKVCPYDTQDCNLNTEGLALNPGIETVMAESNDFDELQYIWREWHEKSGRLMQADYQQFMEISNEAAIKNGFADTGDMWRFEYEYDDLQTSMLDLWEVVKPLYDELHMYVLHELISLYGTDRFDMDDPLIPAHLLGNMWAQSWVNLYERIKPFPEASDIDVTSQMLEQEYTPLRMFETADKFYTDLGLASNEMSYTGESIIEQPNDRLIVCHASAWDFCNGEDFRIKQCTLVNMNHFVTVHHEMGHIQYDIQYKDQPIPFRSGANPGFHEAVGDVIALSVATPQHLQKIGLLQNYADSVEDNINALFKMALERVAFLPFGFLIDMYRWDLFSGQIPQNDWNSHWELLRETYQKVRSPVQRTSVDFDPGAKFHVASGYQYINYFIAHILQFQLHKSLCTKAGQYDPANPDLLPLHKCDIDGSQEAGDALKAGLSLGLSRHWSETLEIMTGETDLKADALLEYFAPLRQFLRDANDNWVPPVQTEDPPVTDPPGTDPSITDPPVTDPPVTDPPVTNPPVTNPPITNPPPDQPEPIDEEIPLTPIIVGSVVGGAVIIGVAAALIYFFIKKQALASAAGLLKETI